MYSIEETFASYLIDRKQLAEIELNLIFNFQRFCLKERAYNRKGHIYVCLTICTTEGL